MKKRVFVKKMDCWIYIDENEDEKEAIDKFNKNVKKQRKFMCRTKDEKPRTTSWSYYKRTGKRNYD
jgi:hypothetical protein